MTYVRSRFLTLAGLGLAGAFARPGAAAELPGPAAHSLKELLAGNARFVADRATCPPLTARRLELAEGQQPFAIVVSCSDSRVPVETVFDQPPGNIFGVRVAGNFVDEHGLGSIEYAIAALGSGLILVLGHTACGAIKATVEYVQSGATQPDHIQSLVAALAPSARSTRGGPGDWVTRATERNVHDAIASLPARSPIVADAVRRGTLAIAGGIYDLHSGRVSLIA
ncbi:MAG: carbonic anhydrase [bacterium]|nr:carbonic anhydrase [bacterium]